MLRHFLFPNDSLFLSLSLSFTAPLPSPFLSLLPFFINHTISQLNTISISSLKVVWHKDPTLNRAIEYDKCYKQCAHVVKEVLNKPRKVIPLCYLEKHHKHMCLKVKANTFLDQNLDLLDLYYDHMKPKTKLVNRFRIRGTQNLRWRLHSKEKPRIFSIDGGFWLNGDNEDAPLEVEEVVVAAWGRKGVVREGIIL